jgi:hypothetical protein
VEFAYHGTYQETAEIICIKGEGFKITPTTDPIINSNLWFGEGIYFYDGDDRKAKDWPKRAQPGNRVAIIQSRIRLGVMLDVQTLDGQDAIKSAYETIKRNDEIPRNQITDATVIDFLAKVLKFDTVRGTGRLSNNRIPSEIYTGSNLVRFKALIICVKNVAMIEQSIIVWSGTKEREQP